MDVDTAVSDRDRSEGRVSPCPDVPGTPSPCVCASELAVSSGDLRPEARLSAGDHRSGKVITQLPAPPPRWDTLRQVP